MSSSKIFFRLISSITLALILPLSGCGGGGSSITSPGGGPVAAGTDCTHPLKSDVDGCTYVELSDDTGDFLVYRVKVTKLSLTRRDGTVASVLPASTTVDFAQYTNLAEYLSLSAAPAGDYTSAIIGLDFSGADIEAQDSSGNAIALNPVDTSGKPLGTVTVTVSFDSTHPLSLFAGQAHVFAINFDLNASNVINAGSHTVTVQPLLVASIDTPVTTAEQVHGAMSKLRSNTITLSLRPFQGGSGGGDLQVYVTGNTTYLVNQKAYTGSAGLSALHAAGNNTNVVAQGNFDFTSRHFVATQVLAGSSSPGGGSAAVEGIVTARNGDTLTVRSAELYPRAGTPTFSDTATVEVSTSTAVEEADNFTLSPNSDNISVGEHILAFGSLASSTTLDATNGLVLLRFTDVAGSVLNLVDNGDNSSVNLNLDEIQNRPISLFDFTGTASDPTNYLIHLPCSCLNTGVGLGDPVIVTGLPSAFASAPPDFNGQALTDFRLADSVLSVVWSAPTPNAFSAIQANSGIVANLASSPAVETLREGGQVVNLNTLARGSPAVVAKSLGNFAISKSGTVQLYVSFTDFVSALHSDLNAGDKVSGFFAVGGYDEADNLLNATTISVSLD